jgi:dihydrofolate reductase
MRKLKLQMVISLDGFVTAKHGGTDIEWDDKAIKFCIDNLKGVDNILLGRTTAEGFIPHWEGVANNPKDSEYKLGKPLNDIPKIVFSKKLKTSKWDNATLANGDLVAEMKALKKKKGKDMIVYGGHSFVRSLIQHDLIDEYFLLVNPFAYGSGEPIFNSLKNTLQLTLEECKPFPCGIVLLRYARPKQP